MVDHRIEVEEGPSFVCREDQTILDAGLGAGVGLGYGCGHGECGSCKALVLSGEYDLSEDISPFALLEHELEEGMTLLCSTRPYSDLTIRVELPEPTVPMIPVREHVGELAHLERVSAGMLLMRLRLSEQLSYYPGQYFELAVPGSQARRAYSFAVGLGGATVRSSEIEFLLRVNPGGVASTWALEATPGVEVRISAPYGNMILKPGDRTVLLVAGGSGIGPIRSLVQALEAEVPQRAAWLFHGARIPDELVWRDEFQALAADAGWFRYHPAISEPDSCPTWSGETGHIAGSVATALEAIVPPIDTAYVCGPPVMVQSVRKVLASHGLPDQSVMADEF